MCRDRFSLAVDSAVNVDLVKLVALIAALLAAGIGLVAAWYWRRSAQVQINPGWGMPGSGLPAEPGDLDVSNMAWTAATLRAFSESAALNQRAANLTAISVLLGAASALLSALAD